MESALRWRLDAILGSLLFIGVVLVALGGVPALAGINTLGLPLGVGVCVSSPSRPTGKVFTVSSKLSGLCINTVSPTRPTAKMGW
jgi:hypothetical protein